MSTAEKWYKDEGGRENLLSVVVRLEDADGNVVTGQNVPLKLVLVYEDGKIANGQDKLYSPDSTHAIGPTGETTIRFRVEDVTKNHHNQKFRLRAMPDAVRTFRAAPATWHRSADVVAPSLALDRSRATQ